MTNTRSSPVACVLLLICLPSALWGYIDPGAGSMVLQLLLGGLAGLYSVWFLFKQKIKSLFTKSEPREK